MSDYIKREDAIFIALQQPFYSVVSQIKQLEGIDIVRCKECKHREEYPCKVYHDDDWFCADGERRSDEQ